MFVACCKVEIDDLDIQLTLAFGTVKEEPAEPAEPETDDAAASEVECKKPKGGPSGVVRVLTRRAALHDRHVLF